MLKFTLVGAREAQKRLSKPLGRMLEINTQKAAEIQLRWINRQAPRKTGRLERSRKVHRRGKFEFEIVEGQFYGGILREGSPSHTILPRKKKALAWPGMIGGPYASVSHPGIKARDYVNQAIALAQGDLDRLTGQFGVQVVTELGGG